MKTKNKGGEKILEKIISSYAEGQKAFKKWEKEKGITPELTSNLDRKIICK